MSNINAIQRIIYQHLTDEMPYIIYAAIKSLIKQINGWAHNPEKCSTIKIGGYIPSRHSVSTIWAFDKKENSSNSYIGEVCMKKFWTSLREHATNVINFEKKKK